LLETELELPALTIDGRSFGTPPYMPPEHMQGASTSSASDLWALAVIAYELLAGAPPWRETDPRELCFALQHAPIPHLPQPPDIAARLDAFFASAFARDPDGRPRDAATSFSRFEQALYGGPLAVGDPFSGVEEVELVVPASPTATIGSETLP